MFGFTKSVPAPATVITPMHIADAMTGEQIISALLDNPEQAMEMSTDQLQKLADMPSMSFIGDEPTCFAISVCDYVAPQYYIPGKLMDDRLFMKPCKMFLFEHTNAGSNPEWTKSRLVAMRHDGKTIAWVRAHNLWKRVM